MSWLPISSGTRLPRAVRRKLVIDIMDALERGVPTEVLQRKLLHQTSYTLPGVNVLIREARLRLDAKRESHNEKLDFE